MVLRVSHHAPGFHKDILKTILVETIHSLSVEFTNIRNGIVDYINRKGFPSHPLKHLIAIDQSTPSTTLPTSAPVLSGSGELPETGSGSGTQKDIWVPGEIVAEARKSRRTTGTGAEFDMDDDAGYDDMGDW
jgi:hypothetical protein